MSKAKSKVETKGFQIELEVKKHHTVLEEFQRVYKMAKGKTPSKPKIAVMAINGAGLDWMKKEIESMRKEIIKNV